MPKDVTVTASVRRDLASLGRRDPALRTSALAALALALARELDQPDNSATSKAGCARELRETLDRLRELAPPEAVPDGVTVLQDQARLKLAQ